MNYDTYYKIIAQFDTIKPHTSTQTAYVHQLVIEIDMCTLNEFTAMQVHHNLK